MNKNKLYFTVFFSLEKIPNTLVDPVTMIILNFSHVILLRIVDHII